MTILHVDSSINLETSATRAISKSIVDQLQAAGSGERIVYRDLVVDPLPHLTFDSFADTAILDEFLSADTVVIGAGPGAWRARTARPIPSESDGHRSWHC